MNEPSKATQWTSRYPPPLPPEWMNESIQTKITWQWIQRIIWLEMHRFECGGTTHASLDWKMATRGCWVTQPASSRDLLILRNSRQWDTESKWWTPCRQCCRCGSDVTSVGGWILEIFLEIFFKNFVFFEIFFCVFSNFWNFFLNFLFFFLILKFFLNFYKFFWIFWNFFLNFWNFFEFLKILKKNKNLALNWRNSNFCPQKIRQNSNQNFSVIGRLVPWAAAREVERPADFLFFFF